MHYGREIIEELLKKETIDEREKKQLVDILFDKFYEQFVQEIDGIDNGVDIGEKMK